GRGKHLWEDVDGDSARDPEEFVPDPDGDYERFYGPGGGFRPVRDAALLVRVEVVLKRMLRSVSSVWMQALAGLSLDLSLEADRQVLPDIGGVAPWDLYGFRKGAEVESGMRDVLARLYLFRYSRRASFRISTRNRHRLDRSFVLLGLEKASNLEVLGRFGLGTGTDLEAELSNGHRRQDGEQAFSYEVHQQTGSVRSYWRINRGWQTSLAVQVGQDHERIRELTATRFSLRPEVIRALAGRGRVRTYLAWTYVAAPERFPLFLGLAQGDQAGQNLNWQCSVDYRMGRYLTAFLSYDGRVRPGRQVLHLGRMEMRAIF
ncbi:MAG: hypothetical protein O2954_06990, partial [bacterium]|nr:hypothetical protein [bacterium]